MGNTMLIFGILSRTFKGLEYGKTQIKKEPIK